MKCPRCGSKRTAPILYGMPAMNEEMARQLDNEELFFGGCCIFPAQPTHHCFACKKNFGTPPVLLKNDDEEDLRDIVKEIRFKVDYARRPLFPEIIITKKNDRIVLDVMPASIDAFPIQRDMTAAEWNKLLNRLFCKLYLHEWKKRFTPDKGIVVSDGDSWDLTLKMTIGRIRTYRGENAYPPYWAELKTTFRPFFKECEEKKIRRSKDEADNK